MSNMKLEGILAISLAALIMTACIPLILRKVRMNKAYGFRTKLAFKRVFRKWFLRSGRLLGNRDIFQTGDFSTAKPNSIWRD